MSGLDATPPTRPSGLQVIQAYGNGGFRIAGERHRGSCLVFRERTRAWGVGRAEDISVESLGGMVATEEGVRILLVGCGRRFSPPPKPIVEALRAHGINVEWMDTGAACRTFNVLLGEDREVAAALIAVD